MVNAKWEKADVDHLESLIRADDFCRDTKPGQVRADNMKEFGKYTPKQFSNKFNNLVNKIYENEKEESKFYCSILRVFVFSLCFVNSKCGLCMQYFCGSYCMLYFCTRCVLCNY